MTDRTPWPRPDDAHTVEADDHGQVSFEVAHVCGETHTMTGWRTAAPGLVVFLDGPPNTPCGLHEPYEQWAIWQLPGYEVVPGQPTASGVICWGFEEPESAMRAADRIGQARAGQLSLDELLTDIIGPDYVLEPLEETAALPPTDPPSLDLDPGGW
jgi:hypothetical protein